jgi:uncharacterized delta-60 repeat protein
MRLRPIEQLERRQLLSGGDPDPTFGIAGIALADSREIDGPRTMAITADGRILTLASGAADGQATVIRYNVDGSPDATFHADSFSFDTDPDSSDVAVSIVAAPDGKILVSGQTAKTVQDNPDFDPVTQIIPYLRRLNADGTIDSSFGSAGETQTDVEVSSNNLAIEPSGKIVLTAGQFVSRYNADGSRDQTFNGGTGGDGSFPWPDGSAGNIVVIAEQQDGKIIGAGNELVNDQYGMILTRLNNDGTIDTTFGDQGISHIALQGTGFNDPQAIVQQPGGKIVVAVQQNFELSAVRLNANGSLDSTFGDNGYVFVPFDIDVDTRDVKLDSQGRLVLVGQAVFETAQHRFFMTRLFGADGSIDPSFGRVDVGNQQFLCYWTGFDLAPDGSPILQAQVARNLESIYTVRQLIRFTADASIVAPIRLSSGTLSIAGTDAKDVIEVAGAGGSAHDVVLATRNVIGREFDASAVARIDINAAGGNDVVSLTSLATPSLISGGDGNDRIAGSGGRDTISGNAGRDTIDGGDAADLLIGNGGPDKLRGMGGPDHLYGGAGNDTLAAGGGNDRLTGGDGGDLLQGNAGNDSFFTSDDSAIDTLFGDAGQDTATADFDDLLTAIETTA